MGLLRTPAVVSGIGAVFLLAGAQCSPVSDIPEASAAAQTEPSETPTPDASPRADADGREPKGPSRPAVAERPPLSAQALAARYAAQRRVLGRDLPFEDDQGQPLQLPVAPTDDAPEGAGAGTPAGGDGGLLDALPGSAGMDADGALDGTTRANGNALGLFVPVETRSSDTLAGFHQALRQLAAGERETVRVAVYGASHTQADYYPSYLRTYLHNRFGDGGRGVVSLVKYSRWYRPSNFVVESSKHWKIEHVQKKDHAPEGWFGLIGVSGHSSNKRAWTRVEPRDASDPASFGRSYDLMFLRQPGGGKFKIFVDGSYLKTVSTRAKEAGPGFERIETELGPHKIEIRPTGNGEVRLFGVSVERGDPGVVVDTLGISGTRAANHLGWHEPVWTEAFKRRDVQLYMLAYGTNETTDEDQPMEVYRRELRAVLERMRREAPEASCLLVGPGDFPAQSADGVWSTRPRLVEIVEAQRAIAYELDCGFWDALAFMGGVGSMHTWATSKPSMAKRDHIHLTRRGYVRMGMALTDALMAGYEAAASAAPAARDDAAPASDPPVEPVSDATRPGDAAPAQP